RPPPDRRQAREAGNVILRFVNRWKVTCPTRGTRRTGGSDGFSRLYRQRGAPRCTSSFSPRRRPTPGAAEPATSTLPWTTTPSWTSAAACLPSDSGRNSSLTPTARAPPPGSEVGRKPARLPEGSLAGGSTGSLGRLTAGVGGPGPGHSTRPPRADRSEAPGRADRAPQGSAAAAVLLPPRGGRQLPRQPGAAAVGRGTEPADPD